MIIMRMMRLMIILIISHNYNNVNVIINITLHLKHVKRSIQKERKQNDKGQNTEPEEGAGTSRDIFHLFQYIHLRF